MKLHLHIVRRFLRYYLRAETVYQLHAPFAFECCRQTVEDKRHYYHFDTIESLRMQLLQDKRLIEIQDFGAGSQANPSQTRTIANITRFSPVDPTTGRMLFRLAHWLQPKTMIELGTSVGLSALYQADAATDSTLYTIEGCPQTALVAQQQFKRLRFDNIITKTGPFAERLPELLSECSQLDWLFLDGDHREGQSLDYFEQCRPKLHHQSVVILADIHWSKEMEAAWESLKRDPAVRLSIDLFHLGLLFFRKEIREKQDYTLIKARWKPWKKIVF